MSAPPAALVGRFPVWASWDQGDCFRKTHASSQNEGQIVAIREDEVSLLHLWQALENIFAVVRILFFLKVRRNDRAWRAQSKKPQSF